MYNLLLRESFEVRPVHGGQRALSLQHRRPKDSTSGRVDSARARVPFPLLSLPGIHYPHVRFFTEVLLPSHLYCDKPILHSVPSVVVRARAHTFSLSLSLFLNATPRVLSSEESACVCVRETRKSAPAIESARREGEIFRIH